MKKAQQKNEASKTLLQNVADLFGVTPQYVGMCISGKRNNPSIVAAYEMLEFGTGKLIEALKKTIDPQ